MNFSTSLKNLMRKKGVTTAELARSLSISPKTISDWLSGRTPRDLAAVRKCAVYLECSVHFLLFGEEDKHSELSSVFESTEIHTGLYEISIKKVKPNSRND